MLSIDGLATGIDTATIIEGLLTIQQRQIDQLESRKAEAGIKQASFAGVESRLLALRNAISRLTSRGGDVFLAKTATSSDENLVLAAKLQEIPYAEKRATDLCEALALGEYWKRPVRTYSRGQAQRVSIARALLHEPRLLLMDEPATGLDVKSTASFIGLIEQQKSHGSIVIIVTHEAKFASAVADRVLHMDRGRIVEPKA